MNQEIIASNDTRIKSISQRKNRAGRVPVVGGTNFKWENTQPPSLDDVILWGEGGAPCTLADIIQMLEIDIMMGRRQDFHKRLLRTIESLIKANG